MNSSLGLTWIWLTSATLIAACVSLAVCSSFIPYTSRPLETIHLGSRLAGDELYDTLRQWNPILQRTPDGVLIYQNSFYQFCFEADSPERAEIYIVARGEPVNRQYPFVDFKIYGHFQNGLFITSADWGLYRVPFEFPPGESLFELSYLNDAFAYPEDKNLFIQSITINVLPETWRSQTRFNAPCFIDPALMSLRKWAALQSLSVAIWNHGELTDDVYFDAAKVHTIYIRASSKATGAPFPHLSVHLDDRSIFTAAVAGDSGQTYTLHVRAGRGLRRLSLKNISSSRKRPVEQDIIVEGIWVDMKPPAELLK